MDGSSEATEGPLSQRKCTPCEGTEAPLTHAEIETYRSLVDPRWSVVDDHHIKAEFSFQNFVEALDFTNRVGEIAEAEGHHPEVCLTWGRATVKLWTHAIDGLSVNDFIVAAKVDGLSG